MSKVDQINRDELNCPVCLDGSLMLVERVDSEEIDDGVQCTCPSCGFYVGGAEPRMVEGAVRVLWDYLPVGEPPE